MTPERWKAIETLFESCLALAPSERAALLENHAAEDPELVTEVAALLVEAEQTGRLEALLEAPARTAMEAMGALGPGDRVGAYRVEKLLGEGGMGKVFLARRDDEAFEQEVAIKLLPPGAAARGLRGRFLAERQILARLEHPHIARLLDGGTTDDGQPFLVMEYVDGDTLLDHCDRERLGIPERLCLFRRVASAVEH
ncbi:MAG: protein kinase, partial [Acidobacteriota bacterium]